MFVEMETPHDKRPVGPARSYARIINWSRAVFVPVSQSLSPRRFNGRVGFNHKDHKGGTKNTKSWLVRFTVGNICGAALTSALPVVITASTPPMGYGIGTHKHREQYARSADIKHGDVRHASHYGVNY
jgi:hypothetical protein